MLERTCEEVDAYLGRHPHEQQRLCALRAQLAEESDPFARSNMAGHLTSSVLVFDAGRTHVLLIHHKVYASWMQPGGHVEPESTSLLDSGLREVQEETGLPGADMQPLLQGGVLDIDTHAIAASRTRAKVRTGTTIFSTSLWRAGPSFPGRSWRRSMTWHGCGSSFLSIPGQRMQHLVPKLRRFLTEADRP